MPGRQPRDREDQPPKARRAEPAAGTDHQRHHGQPQLRVAQPRRQGPQQHLGGWRDIRRTVRAGRGGGASRWGSGPAGGRPGARALTASPGGCPGRTRPPIAKAPAQRPVLLGYLARRGGECPQRSSTRPRGRGRGIRRTIRVISRRCGCAHGLDQFPPRGRQRHAHFTAIAACPPAVDEILAHEPIAHPRRRRTLDLQQSRQVRYPLRAPRR